MRLRPYANDNSARFNAFKNQGPLFIATCEEWYDFSKDFLSSSQLAYVKHKYNQNEVLKKIYELAEENQKAGVWVSFPTLHHQVELAVSAVLIEDRSKDGLALV